MIKYVLASIILCICLLFASCGSMQYSDTLPCDSVTMALKDKIFVDTEYSKYTSADVDHMFSSALIEDSCVIYSSSSDDIGEFGVLCASDENNARQLLEQVEDHIESIKKERHGFLKSYMPSELNKLSGAQVKQYGKYVVFAVHDPAHVSQIFKEAKRILTMS